MFGKIWKLFDQNGDPGPEPRTGSRYFLVAACSELVSNYRTLENVQGGIALIKAGAEAAGNTKGAEEMAAMIEALEKVRENLLRTAKDYDPREGVHLPKEYSDA